MVVATDTQHRHVEQHMARRIGTGEDVKITDRTEDYAYINLQGPRSRELLQSITANDMSDKAFPFRAAKEIEVGGVNFRAVRITYVGELGYELYVPKERAVEVYDVIVEAGKEFGLKHVGEKLARRGSGLGGASRFPFGLPLLRPFRLPWLTRKKPSPLSCALDPPPLSSRRAQGPGKPEA